MVKTTEGDRTMLDKYGFMLLMFCVAVLGSIAIHLEGKIEKLEKKEVVIESDITELKKKQRLNAQDLKFFEYLITEGKDNGN